MRAVPRRSARAPRPGENPPGWALRVPARGGADGSLEAAFSSSYEIGDGDGAFISGDGTCFTVYLDFLIDEPSCRYRKAALQSGCLTESGVEDWQLASVVTDIIEGCESWDRRVGDVRISDEMDGMAARW